MYMYMCMHIHVRISQPQANLCVLLFITCDTAQLRVAGQLQVQRVCSNSKCYSEIFFVPSYEFFGA